MFHGLKRFTTVFVLGFLAFSVSAEPAAVKVLIFGGGNAHTFAADVQPCIEFLEKDKQYQVEYTEAIEQLTAENLKPFDVLILHCCRNHPDNKEATTDAFKQALTAYIRDGGGVIFMHCAVASFYDWDSLIDLTGGIWVWGQSQHDAYQTMKSTVVKTDHPVTAGLPEQFEFPDEFYHTLKLQPTSKVLIEGTHAKNDENVREPLAWIAKDTDSMRTLTLIYGHDRGAWDNTVFRTLLTNSIEWAAFRK